MRTERRDVVIVGAGPAGLFAAHELRNAGMRDVLVLDAGAETAVRDCPLTVACNCRPCDILEGIGGSGGVSDGKMTFALDRGTQLEPVFRPEHESLLAYVDSVMVREGTMGVRYDPHLDLPRWATEGDIHFSTYPLWHVGSDGVRYFSQHFTERVRRMGAEVRSRARVERLEGQTLVVRERGPRGKFENHHVVANHVLLAVGIFGIGWLEEQLSGRVRLGTGPGGIGLRVETPSWVQDPLFSMFYDWKGIGEFSGYTMRSFCCNHHGHIMPEYHPAVGIRNVNGHSYLDPARRTESSNFSLQAKITTNHEGDPKEYVRGIARVMNLASGGWQIRQPARQFVDPSWEGETSEAFVTYPQARVARIDHCLPQPLYRAFRDYLIALDRILPGTIAQGWLYGPEVKYHARTVPVRRDDWSLEGADDIYVVGDSTGLTGSYVSAALTGIIAARGLAERTQKEEEYAAN